MEYAVIKHASEDRVAVRCVLTMFYGSSWIETVAAIRARLNKLRRVETITCNGKKIMRIASMEAPTIHLCFERNYARSPLDNSLPGREPTAPVTADCNL